MRSVDYEGLTAREHLRRRESGGARFARGALTEGRAGIQESLLSLMSSRNFNKGISVLTMPGLHWRFEHALLRNREGPTVINGNRRPRRTWIVGVEKEEEIFRAGFKAMPAFENGVVDLPPAPYASTTIRTYLITRFHRADICDLILQQKPGHGFHLAWLDFTGQLSDRRIEAIKELWQNSIKPGGYLSITSMNGRWSGSLLAAVEKYNGLANAVQSILDAPISEGMVTRYSGVNGTPMIHLVLHK